MLCNRALTLLDLPWLRLAGKPTGALNVPDAIARNLLSCGYVNRHEPSKSLRITSRGQLALTRLG
jgi:hypothetical protein